MVSPVEKALLAEEVAGANVHVVQLVIPEEPQGPISNCAATSLFIGGYQHTPNVEAVLYFAREILPLVLARIPDLRFRVMVPGLRRRSRRLPASISRCWASRRTSHPISTLAA